MKEKIKYPFFFVLTLLTTTFAGAEWTIGKSAIYITPLLESDFWYHGFSFSIPFLFILTCHEFGHYFTARYYKAAVTLPLYIPMWLFGMPSIGTMGAYIQIKSPLRTTKEFFDVGIAGPIAGFVAAVVLLIIGFSTLPPADYIFTIHPEYKEMGLNYADYVYKNKSDVFYLGDNLLFIFFRYIFEYQGNAIPNAYEMMHYPVLFAGYLACFFTALNLLPIGQLDGGHVLYGLIGWKRFNALSPYLFKALILFSGIGVVSPFQETEVLMYSAPLYLLFLFVAFSKLYPNLKTRVMWILSIFTVQFIITAIFPSFEGYQGYLVFGLVIGRFLGVHHPRSIIEQPIGTKRKVLGWIAIIIFILCLSPKPFVFV